MNQLYNPTNSVCTIQHNTTLNLCVPISQNVTDPIRRIIFWIFPSNKPGAHKSSKNLAATPKFETSEGWQEGSSVLKTHKYYAPQWKVYSPGYLAPAICAPLMETLLTYFTQQSPSWEANKSSDGQKIPRILWNPKVYFAFTRARHLSLPWARSIQSIPSAPFLEESF
jgi:hypothetical protein